MTIGNLVEIYLSAKDNVNICMADSQDYLYDGMAKDVPSGFYKWMIKRVSLEKDKLLITVRSANVSKEEYNEELTVFDLKSCIWLDNTIRYIIRYKDDSDEVLNKMPQTLRALEKEVWNESLIDKLLVKEDYIVLAINDTRENVIDKLNKKGV